MRLRFINLDGWEVSKWNNGAKLYMTWSPTPISDFFFLLTSGVREWQGYSWVLDLKDTSPASKMPPALIGSVQKEVVQTLQTSSQGLQFWAFAEWIWGRVVDRMKSNNKKFFKSMLDLHKWWKSGHWCPRSSRIIDHHIASIEAPSISTTFGIFTICVIVGTIHWFWIALLPRLTYCIIYILVVEGSSCGGGSGILCTFRFTFIFTWLKKKKLSSNYSKEKQQMQTNRKICWCNFYRKERKLAKKKKKFKTKIFKCNFYNKNFHWCYFYNRKKKLFNVIKKWIAFLCKINYQMQFL